jgi:hypothetical protein
MQLDAKLQLGNGNVTDRLPVFELRRTSFLVPKLCLGTYLESKLCFVLSFPGDGYKRVRGGGKM